MVRLAKRRPFSIVYDPEVKAHLLAIERKHHPLIQAAIANQLSFQPEVETRSRKPLSREVDFAAEWELRFGPNNCFRVFYSVDQEQNEVQVLAIGCKYGNRLFIAGEEIIL